jgi:hypothetical protein
MMFEPHASRTIGRCGKLKKGPEEHSVLSASKGQIFQNFLCPSTTMIHHLIIIMTSDHHQEIETSKRFTLIQ